MASCIEGGFFCCSWRRRHTRCSRDWSSDVCSSDLGVGVEVELPPAERLALGVGQDRGVAGGARELAFDETEDDRGAEPRRGAGAVDLADEDLEIGRASCRERV